MEPCCRNCFHRWYTDWLKSTCTTSRDLRLLSPPVLLEQHSRSREGLKRATSRAEAGCWEQHSNRQLAQRESASLPLFVDSKVVWSSARLEAQTHLDAEVINVHVVHAEQGLLCHLTLSKPSAQTQTGKDTEIEHIRHTGTCAP